MDASNFNALNLSTNGDAIAKSNLSSLLIDEDLVSQLLEPANSLPFSRRTMHLLEKYGIKTIADLSTLQSDSSICIRGIGQITLKEIREITESHFSLLISKYPVENIILALKRIQCDSNSEPPTWGKSQNASDTTSSSLSIESLPLPVRVINALFRNGVKTKDDLLNTSEEKLLGFKNMGAKSIEQINCIKNEYLHNSENNSREQKSNNLSSVSNQLDIPNSIKKKFTTIGINNLNDLSQYSEEALFIEAQLAFQEFTRVKIYLNSLCIDLRKCWPVQALVSERDFIYLERLGVPFNEIDISRLALPNDLDEILRKQLLICTLSSLLSQSTVVLQAALLFNNNNSLKIIEKNIGLYFDWLSTQSDWNDEVTRRTISPVIFLQLKETSLANIIEYLFAALPKEKHRRIMGLRYGIDEEKRNTLQEIAKQFHISRERVRQIEADAINKLRKLKNENLIHAIYFYINEEMEKRGCLMSVDQLVTFIESFMEIGEIQFGGAVCLLLSLEDGLFLELEPSKLWGLKSIRFEIVLSVRRELFNILKNHFSPLTYLELVDHLKSSQWYSSFTNQDLLSDEFIRACLSTDDHFEEIENDQFILGQWKKSKVDDIVMALRKLGKPTHFTEIAKTANETLHPMRQLSARNCHAILMRKVDLFVWVGRGTYGLSDWGINRVRFYVDIADEYLDQRKEYLSIEEIYSHINKERKVSIENISFMLGTNHRFSRNLNNKYGLARWTQDAIDDVDAGERVNNDDPFLDDLKKRFFYDFLPE